MARTLNETQHKYYSSAISGGIDSFGRSRVGNPFPVFDNKNLFNRNTGQWEEETNGVGASISYVSAESSIQLQVGTVSGEYAIRQTSRYFSYIPGKSQFIAMTGVLGGSKTNVVKRIGYFDDNNGLFFEQDDTATKVVVRTNTSGSPVDSGISQDSWNLDKLDGTGPSGKVLDITKAQIFIIDFQWLGVGRIRYGLNIDGDIVYCHQVKNANDIDKVYMASATLPLRYEIRNTGTSTSSTTLKEICCSVSSEGGYTLPGLEFAASSGVTTRAVTTRTPILAIRLLNTFESKENRRTIKFVHTDTFTSTNDAFFEIAHIHNPSGITATWTGVGGGSAVEYSTNITAVTGNPEHIIESFFVPTSVGNKSAQQERDLGFINLHSYASQNFDSTNSQMFVIYATPFAGTADVTSSITWIEFD